MKTKSIIFILIITLFLLLFNTSYAVDLDITDNSNLLSDNSINNTDNTNTDNTSSNTNYNENNNSTYNNTVNDSNYETTPIENPVTVTDINSTSDDGLQLSDILNILLIVIGILLILLAIAILIRLKK